MRDEKMVTIAIPIKRGLKVCTSGEISLMIFSVTIAIPIKRGLKVCPCIGEEALTSQLQLLSRLKGD